MTDRRLEVFHTVGRLLSFTKAADQLKMTQPAVTFQVRQLEEQLKVRLFDRSHNRIDMTEAGKRAYQYSERIFSIYAEMENAIREVTDNISGILRIGAGNAAAQYVLTPLISAFQKQFPDIQIQLQIAPAHQILSLVDNSQVDIGMVEGKLAGSKWVIHHYKDEYWRLVVSARHPLAKKEIIHIDDLIQQTWILPERGVSSGRDVTLSYFQQLGIDYSALNIAMEISSAEMIKNALESGHSIALLPESAIEKELQAGVFKILTSPKICLEPMMFIYKAQKFPLRMVEEYSGTGDILPILKLYYWRYY